MNNPFSLAGKKILVTGASSGIGKAIAIECSKMGGEMCVTARNEERLTATMEALDGPRELHNMILADLTNQEELENLVAQMDNIDGLVLCSGMGMTFPVQFCTRDKFDKIFDVNLFAPIELLRLLYKKKKLKKSASVVVIASIGGPRRITPGNAVYGASKVALNAVMKYSAREFSARMIRVNSILPGMVETPLIRRGTITEEQYQKDMETYPLKRYGKPEDIAYAAIYLLSNASDWVTGQEFVIDGGCTL